MGAETRIEGKVTRGKTAPGRLAALDALLVELAPGLLSMREDALVVDLGFGEVPHTTVELARALRARWPEVRVIGVEIDAARVERARSAFLREQFDVDWRGGGFELSLAPGERPALVRAMNVLRQYEPSRCEAACELMSTSLAEGGLLLEGSCDRRGQRLGAHLMRRRDGVLAREALVFYTDASSGFAPIMFRDWLPQDLRRGLPGDHPIFAFFEDWTRAWREVRQGAALTPAQSFAASARALARSRPGVCTDEELLARGYLVWRPPGGVPRRGGSA